MDISDPQRTMFLPALLLGLFGMIIPVLMVTVGKFLRPSRPSKEKLAPYECGVDPIGDAKGRQTVHFYLIAVIFLVFDVEAVFLFPWSVMLKDAPGHFLFIEGMLFIALLLAAFAYAWGKGALQWND